MKDDITPIMESLSKVFNERQLRVLRLPIELSLEAADSCNLSNVIDKSILLDDTLNTFGMHFSSKYKQIEALTEAGELVEDIVLNRLIECCNKGKLHNGK